MSEKLLVGKIANTQGLKGHVKIFPYTTDKTEFDEFDYLIIDNEGNEKFKINSIRYQKNMVIVLFEGFNNISEVEKFKNREVYFLREDLGEMDSDSFMYSEVIGYDVIDAEQGLVGKLKKVDTGAAHELIIVEKEDGSTFMIPSVKAFIKKFDHKSSELHVTLIEGMMNDI